MKKHTLIAGLDEAGRGPLAGPVIAAAVILDPRRPIQGLADSKLLSEKKRQRLAEEIQEKSLAYAIGQAEVSEIEQLNILQASLLAMGRAYASLSTRPTEVWVDGNQAPVLDGVCTLRTIIRGDQTEPVISAASILAKVTRDAQMCHWHQQYPAYGFDQHKGYPTKLHRQRLQAFGPCPLHRKTFRGVISVSPSLEKAQGFTDFLEMKE